MNSRRRRVQGFFCEVAAATRASALLTAVALAAAPACNKAPPAPSSTTVGEKIKANHTATASESQQLGKAPDGMPSPHGGHGMVSRSKIGELPMDGVILVVDNMTFTRADLERTITQSAALAGVPPDAIDAGMRDAFEQGAYEKLLERFLLAAEARKRGLWPSADDAAKQRAEMLKSLPQGKTVDEVLRALKTDDASFQREIETDLAIGRLFEAVHADTPVPADAALKKIYEEHKDAFATKDSARAMHLVVRAAQNAAPANVEAARSRALALKKEAAGTDEAAFAALARTKSEDPSAQKNGGDIGEVRRGETLPAFEAVLFKLKKGELSEPVRSPGGWHILRGGGVTKGKQLSFDEAKKQIAEREKVRAFMSRIDELVEKLRGVAKIERRVEPVASPLVDGDRGGVRVPSWRPTSKNASPNRTNPHGIGGSVPLKG